MTTAANLHWISYHFTTNSTFVRISYKFFIFKPRERKTCVFRNSHVKKERLLFQIWKEFYKSEKLGEN